MKKILNTTAFVIFINISLAQIPTVGLQAYWAFDGNANDLSGNGNNGVVNGATLTSDRFGNPNRAYLFNGVSNRIDVLNSSTINIPNNHDFSISFWIKTNPANNDGCPIAKTVWGSWDGYLFYADNTNPGYCSSPGQLSFYVASNAQQDACADAAICDDYTNWYFITGTYDALNNESYLYVNGLLQSDMGAKYGSISNTMGLSFGAHNSGHLFFNGSLDGIRLYDVILDQNGIDALYNEVDPAAGINESSFAFENMNLFPNPTDGKGINLTFTSDIPEKAKIQVIDNIGNLVFEDSKNIFVGKNDVKFNAEKLAGGFYYLKISSGTHSQNIKFIKE